MAYTTIDKPTDYFNTKLWTGDGNSTQAISGVGHQPDLVWIKNRNLSSGPNLFFDSVRGANKALVANNSNAEASVSGYLNSFDSDGFTVGNDGAVNGSGDTYCSWNWKAGGSASSNSNGSITSSVSANISAGFSIVKWTGNVTAGATVGHGLGVKPNFIIAKGLDVTENWNTYDSVNGAGKYLILDTTSSVLSSGGRWNSTEPNSTVFTLGDSGNVNGNNNEHIAYCFTSIKGYSKFGSYTGNGDNDGTFVYTGFKVAVVICKKTSSTGDWELYDNKRDGYNGGNIRIHPNDSAAEGGTGRLSLLSNGFKITNSSGNLNGSGDTFIYMAFAENPFVTSTGIPTTAR